MQGRFPALPASKIPATKIQKYFIINDKFSKEFLPVLTNRLFLQVLECYMQMFHSLLCRIPTKFYPRFLCHRADLGQINRLKVKKHLT